MSMSKFKIKKIANRFEHGKLAQHRNSRSTPRVPMNVPKLFIFLMNHVPSLIILWDPCLSLCIMKPNCFYRQFYVLVRPQNGLWLDIWFHRGRSYFIQATIVMHGVT